MVKLVGGRVYSCFFYGYFVVYYLELLFIIIYGGIVVRLVRYIILFKKMFVFNIVYKFWIEIEYISNMELGLVWVF